jgi:hypothetical protein
VAVFDMPDEKAIVIGIIHSLANADFPSAELQAANFIQLAAGLDALIFWHVSIFAIAARRRNHMAPRFLGEGLKPNFYQRFNH